MCTGVSSEASRERPAPRDDRDRAALGNAGECAGDPDPNRVERREAVDPDRAHRAATLRQS